MPANFIRIGIFLLILFGKEHYVKGQVFLSETYYFDKEMQCVATAIKGDKTTILEGLATYCKKLGYPRLLTKVVYLSYKDISFKTGKRKSYNIHFKLIPTKLDSLYYLYMMVLTTNNKSLNFEEDITIPKEATLWLDYFIGYYYPLYLITKSVNEAKRNLFLFEEKHKKTTNDSLKTMRNLSEQIAALIKTLEKEKNILHRKDSEYHQLKNDERKIIANQVKTLDSLEKVKKERFNAEPLP